MARLTTKQRRRLESALVDLIWIYEAADLDNSDQTKVSAVRSIIHDILDGEIDIETGTTHDALVLAASALDSPSVEVTKLGRHVDR